MINETLMSTTQEPVPTHTTQDAETCHTTQDAVVCDTTQDPERRDTTQDAATSATMQDSEALWWFIVMSFTAGVLGNYAGDAFLIMEAPAEIKIPYGSAVLSAPEK